MGIYPSKSPSKSPSKRGKAIEKIEDGVWIKFLAPMALRKKLIKYCKSQGKSYAQVIREFIEQLPVDVEEKKKDG